MSGRLVIAFVVVATLAACNAGSTTSGQASPPPIASPAAAGSSSQAPSASTTASGPSGAPAASLPAYNPTIDPAKFSAAITNAYFPLKPGQTYIYEGKRDDQPRRTEMAVTTETKTIMGVKCIVVRDVLTSNGALVEKTVDWYAQDLDGNVWYFGEDTAEYVNGAVTSTAGTWLAGVDAALPGIVMKAHPAVGDAYRQEYRPGVAEDFAKVQKIDATVTVPAGSYDKVVVTEDTDLLDTTKLEHKSYAPGVGFVGSEGVVNGHHEVTSLTSILTKS
jgi:hypothetical protein